MYNEIWKDIKGYEGLYQVSDQGMVRSLNYNRTGKTRVLKLKENRYGYLQVGLWKDGIQKSVSVHRLVWSAFVGEIPKGMQIDHRDGCKTNNSLSNLRVCTPKENSNNPATRPRHLEAIKKRSQNPEWRKNKAESNKKLAQDHEWQKNHTEGTRKACNKPILQIDKQTGEVIRIWECARDASRKLGVDFSLISKCCRGIKSYNSAGGYGWRFA